MPKSDKDIPPTFEEAMDELDAIVQAMEGDRLSLSELIEQYARGMKLEKVCRQQLAVARQKVESITEAADGGGEIEASPFDPADAPTGDGTDAPKIKETTGLPRGRNEKKIKPHSDKDDEIRLF